MNTKATMTTKQQEFLRDVLYPAIHPHLDKILPVLFGADVGSYNTRNAEWQSIIHLDTLTPSSKKKRRTKAPNTINGKDARYLLHDFGHGGVSREIIDFYAQNYHNGIRGKAIAHLSAEYNLMEKYESMYRKAMTPEEKQRIADEEQRTTDLCIARDIFIEELHNNAERGKAVLDYFRERGWSAEDIKASKIGLITPSSRARVKEQTHDRITCRWNKLIGDDRTKYYIAIPLEVNGRLVTFQFRTIDDSMGDEYGKYQYETITRQNVLYGYAAGTREVVIMEGTLDYIHALARGAYGVLTTGGNPTTEKIDYLLRYKAADKITLFYDSDKAGRGHVNKSADVIKKAGKKDCIRVALLPSINGKTCKDVDEWICELIKADPNVNIADEFSQVLANTLVYDEWKPLDIILSFAEDILLSEASNDEKRKGLQTITREQRQQIKESITREQQRELMESMMTFLRQCDPLYMDAALNVWHGWDEIIGRDINLLKPAEGESSLQIDMAAIQTNVNKLYGAYKDGDTYNIGILAKKLVEATSASAREETPSSRWNKYRNDYVSSYKLDRAAIEADQATDPDGLPTCMTFTDGTPANKEMITLDEGLTFLCANTHHGKTSILNRIVIDEATRNYKQGKDKCVLYFTYEIDHKPLIRDLLTIYVNDPQLSANPRRSIKSYFKHRNKIREGHFATFEERKNTFFDEFISLNGYINIVEKAYPFEELIEAIECYISSKDIRMERGEGRDISLIAIDYAQLLFTMEKMQRTEQIQTICDGLKELSRKYHVPIVMPAQFNQQVPTPHHVQLNCIGEGGGYSRYADSVIGFFNLKFLRSMAISGANGGSKVDEENKKILKRLGIDFGDNPIAPISGFVYAKLMKRRGTDYVPSEALFMWDSAIKTIYGNTNPYIADPAMARADNMEIQTAIKKGREDLESLALMMINKINEAKVDGVKILVDQNDPTNIIKTLQPAIQTDEDDPDEHPEYFNVIEQDVTKAAEQPIQQTYSTQEAEMTKDALDDDWNQYAEWLDRVHEEGYCGYFD